MFIVDVIMALIVAYATAPVRLILGVLNLFGAG